MGLGVRVALLGSYLWVACGEVQENRYANYAEAREAQQRGWLPTMLPRSATEIHEWHDLDTNLCLGSFRFDPSERDSIEVALTAGSRRTLRIDRDPSFASTLPRDPDEQQLTNAGFDFYSEPAFDCAISWKDGITYFWNSTP